MIKNDKKTDLSLATFIIPIRLESTDRIRNLFTTLCYLLTHFETNIILKEVDKISVFESNVSENLKKYLKTINGLTHLFERSDSPIFHRQKVLNDMIMECETPIVINYDCDILLPLKSYIKSYEMINSGNADVVYPYGDGKYQRQVFSTDELIEDFFDSQFDLKVFRKHQRKEIAKYGFCQFFKRDVYIEGGLENENFVSYAPEDSERHFRYQRLGYKVKRLSKKVYHMEHFRTINSTKDNPHMNSNDNEWIKIQNMNPEMLRSYITNQEYYKSRISK